MNVPTSVPADGYHQREILAALQECPGQIVPMPALVERLYGSDTSNNRASLRGALRRLRDNHPGAEIESVYGYRIRRGAQQNRQPSPCGGVQNAPERLRNDFLAVLEKQTEKGMRTYGQPVRAWNGRDAGRDAIEEWLDLGIYLTQLRIEHDDLLAENAALRAEIARLTRAAEVAP